MRYITVKTAKKPYKTRKLLTETQREFIRTSLEAGLLPEKIAPTVPCAYITVRRIQRNICLFGKTTAPRSLKQGRPRTLNDEMLDGLRSFLEEKPTACLVEMRSFLYNEYNVRVCNSTVSRVLSEQKWAKKKLIWARNK
ncbi:uncharacterized protein LAJ45_11090 [Morchella importuna]|uniref:uncharacterized protein n=1 Tax=Morchella importuna TaxID=1174673 RepID=UPI001E8CEC7D|nr:uncharacterized protein LAJ45_11090 [Morchella importuna]KAH8144885.1 hypothetical protein LAJ45_11090 [Morchella importuna]